MRAKFQDVFKMRLLFVSFHFGRTLPPHGHIKFARATRKKKEKISKPYLFLYAQQTPQDILYDISTSRTQYTE